MSGSLFSRSVSVLDDADVPPSAVLALDAAGRLERELAALASYLADSADSFGRDTRIALLVDSVEAIAITAHLVRQRVLDSLRRSSAGAIELHERAIRARANIVMRALYVLKGRERELSAAALSGRFRCTQDVFAFLVDRITELYGRWSEQYETARALDVASQHALRYIAADEAEVAFARLGRDPALATFLRVGSTCESEAIRMACGESAAIVGLRATEDDGGANGVSKPQDGRAS